MQSKVGLFQRLRLYKERNAQTLTHTPKQTDKTQKHLWWQLSEFSVNMHAL